MKGFCFLGEPEGVEQKRHLSIILTEPNSTGQVVVVTVTSLKDAEGQQPECVLHAGDHPFIRHDSVVGFKQAEARNYKDIIERQLNGTFIHKEPLEPAVFGRVLKAAKLARKMSPRIKSIQRGDAL